ncbi:MAG: helix-turn-helix domain containing protein, partial [Bacteroidales bacterium]|nr:helix-turn-helix domain containing protein [Bacteroidales bacterium]
MQTAKDHTRRLLLETAREAFLRKGFKAVSMREISRLSGVGLSNIYNYFPCKDDLL